MERILKGGVPYTELARGLGSEPIRVGDVLLSWFEGELPSTIGAEINLGQYRIAEHTAERRTALTAALSRLATVHPEGFARLREFVRGLLWVELQPGTQASSLTSSSDPALPYVVMFSDKARHHIPPNTVSPESSPIFLAENLLHEAVHQSISFHLLQNRAFTPDYSSQDSPKIEIKWRASQGVARNQWWEIDRAFHATCVYNQLVRFRQAELAQNDLDDGVRENLQAALEEGLPAVRYLMDQLEAYDDHFSDHGKDLLRGLRVETDQL
ncbi:hypothetical protein [Kitasatospora herbaricolor]|uniref:hypothetical protein n=1 Tax=Kitasatospora herbaricolor TaxID=68217 RepID=UPI0036DCAA75